MEKSNYGRGLFRQHPRAEDRIDLTPTERQTRWLQFLNLHGCLSSVYLFEYLGNEFRSYRASQVQLQRLWRAGYIYRPRQQRATDNANYHPYIYDLTEKGIDYLIKQRLWVDAIRPSGNWVHQYFISCVTASIHIMCIREGYRYIPPHEYIGSTYMAVKTKIKWTNKNKVTEIVTITLCPDAVFAIDYGGGSFIAYALEADRNTEPNTAHSWNRKSDTRTIKQYRSFIGKKQYKEDYGRDAMMVLLYVTVNDQHARNFIEMVRQETDKGSYMMAGVVPEFETPFKPPALLTHLFEEPLLRVKEPSFTIKKTAS